MIPHPATLRNCAAVLRIQAPPPAPVRVQLVEGLADDEGAWGDCSRGRKIFTIRLDAALARRYPELAAMLLCHEWAHAHTWEELTDHSDAFWLAYGRCWRIWTTES